MKYDLVIYNAKIVTEEEVFLGYICVSDGKIAAMGSDAPVYEAAQSLDAKGMLLLPGAIDTHPHFLKPEQRRGRIWNTEPRPLPQAGLRRYWICLTPPNTLYLIWRHLR